MLLYMAVVYAFRLALWVLNREAQGGYLMRYFTGPGIAGTFKWSKKLAEMAADPSVSDEELAAQASRENEYDVRVATYTEPFEVRRVQLEFSVTGPAVLDEDIRVITFHHVKLTNGLPDSQWVAQNFTDIKLAYYNWWLALAKFYPTGLVYSGIRFYRQGPDLVPPLPPVHQEEFNVPGTSTAHSHPPQVALSVTEIAGQKKNWGRFYLPAPAVTALGGIPITTPSGRPASEGGNSIVASISDDTDILYEQCKTLLLPHVIYRATLPEGRLDAKGNPLPLRPANAQTVEQLQIDDVFDVIRSRRWDKPTLRTQRTVGGPAVRRGPAAGVLPAQDENESDQVPEPEPEGENPE